MCADESVSHSLTHLLGVFLGSQDRFWRLKIESSSEIFGKGTRAMFYREHGLTAVINILIQTGVLRASLNLDLVEREQETNVLTVLFDHPDWLSPFHCLIKFFWVPSIDLLYSRVQTVLDSTWNILCVQCAKTWLASNKVNRPIVRLDL